MPSTLINISLRGQRQSTQSDTQKLSHPIEIPDKVDRMLLGQSILITGGAAPGGSSYVCMSFLPAKGHIFKDDIILSVLPVLQASLCLDYGVIRVYEVKFCTTEGLASKETPKACSDTEAFNGVSKSVLLACFQQF
ncbi:unnamed protein product [Coregonus sp. 'balchen']|nr:unnamed protein product [Coregonus sp. 'balchen']